MNEGIVARHASLRRLGGAARQGGRIARGVLKTLRLAAAGKLRRIPTQWITDEYAFSLAPGGWHYLRALAAEYERDPGVRREETTFWRFFQHEGLRSIRYLNDLLFLHDPDRCRRDGGYKFYLGTYPWGDWTRSYSLVGGNPFGRHYDQVEGKNTIAMYGYRRDPWYLPGDPVALEKEWGKTTNLCRSLRSGYAPVRHGSLPSVVLLVRASGELRAVRYEGHHRLSVLSHLGYKALTVWVLPESVEVIRETEVDEWYYVKRGLCTREQALEIFDAYFELNGRERLAWLGLPPVY